MVSLQLFATRRNGAGTDEVLSDLVAKAVAAERAGFDTVWLAEHHDTDWNLCTDPLTLLATLAAETSTIRLGAAVVNLGLHHPVRIAEQAAMVNALSGGRLELGLGKGFAAADYQRFGLDPADADEVFQEKHDQLVGLLQSDPSTAKVPTWLASSGKPRAVAVAVEHGHGLLLAAAGEKLAGITAYVASQPAPPRLGLVRVVHTGPVEEFKPYLLWYMDQMSKLQPHVTPPPVEEVLDTFCILGAPEDCRQAIDQLCREHRLAELICVPGIGGMSLDATIRVIECLKT